MNFSESRHLQRRAHQLIPGGCHTYAKGDDQFPLLSPGFIARGEGCHVWDVDGNEYIEYGLGCRAVTLGHAYAPVVRAAQREMLRGSNFSRPSPIELECAEELRGMVPHVEMVKFAKDGSTVTTAAVKLARAHTERDMIALCSDHPFFAIHDWFIGTTKIDAGIPDSIKDLTATFRYNQPDTLERVFREYPQRIACVILEPAKYADPEDHFLHRVKELCERYGALFILDEMITGFRWHNGGAQTQYDITPDLSTFGKALANGFSVSALVGKRKYMQAGGIYHDRERVFLLSTTHGAETHSLAAAIEVMRTYQNQPIVDRLHEQGQKLLTGVNRVIEKHGLGKYIEIIGRPCNLVFATRDAEGNPSQGMRALLIQELIRRGVIGQSLVVSAAHSDVDIDKTVNAFDQALPIYRQALIDGHQFHLVGRPSQIVYRSHNDPTFQQPPTQFWDREEVNTQ